MFQYLIGVVLLAITVWLNLQFLAKKVFGFGRGVIATRNCGIARCAVILLGLALLPAGANAQSAYITNSASNTVSVIDTATNTVTATISVGTTPRGIAVTPDGTKAYVANFADNTVSAIDMATNTVTTTIPVGRNPEGIAVTPDGTKAYVVNHQGGTVSVIATASNTVVATLRVFTFGGLTINSYGIAVTPDGTKAYVTSRILAPVVDPNKSR